MKVTKDGDYQLESGTVIPKDKIAKLHKTAPLAEGAEKPKKGLDLREGQSSGPIRLND